MLPLFAAAVVVLLALIALRLAGSLKESLEGEITGRLRIASDLASDLLRSAAALDPLDPQLTAQLERIRVTTSVSAIALYDKQGGFLGGAAPRDQVGSSIPRRIRLGTTSTAHAARVPERDAAGGLTLVALLGAAEREGAILTRVDRDGQGSLPAVDFFFDLSKALAGIVGAAGFLILLRWLVRGDLERPVRKPAPVTGSDVDVVLGTMKEVMSTLKDSETHYRDRSRAAEADAERARRTNALILESIGSGLVAFDETGRITLFNHAAERILGASARNARGRRVEEVLEAGDRLSALAQVLETRGSATPREEIKRIGPDGEPRWLVVTGSVLRAADGESRGGILLVDDLTETRRLRDAVRIKDRLSAVGEMSAGIAHEIKNSLHSLLGHANLLKDDASGEPPLPVQGILAEVKSLEGLVKGILELSRPSRLVRTAVDLNGLLRESAGAVAEAARAASVTVNLELDEAIPPVSADADSVKRVFLNCALNAIEAMEKGGTLTITTRPADLGADDGVGERTRAVRVGFRDTGPGIREEDRERIFTPFFTTKREGHGLGLSLVHKAVTDHGGRVQLHSREKVGTEFVILLPVEARS
ncbi:MAG: ATP-binding protein [bacterium]